MADEIIIETVSAEVIEVGVPGPQGPAGAAGTGLETLTTKGDTLYRGTSTGERLAIGTTGQILRVSASGIPEWGSAPASGVSSVNGETGAVTLDAADVGAAATNHSHQPAAIYCDAVDVADTTLSSGEPNGIYFRDGSDNGKAVYKSAQGYSLFWDEGEEEWVLGNVPQTAKYYIGTGNTEYPWQATSWALGPQGSGETPVVDQALLSNFQRNAAQDAVSTRIPKTGNASSTEVVLGSDTRLSNARTPTAHTHEIATLASTGADEGDLPVAQGDGTVAWQNGTTWAALNITAADVGAAAATHASAHASGGSDPLTPSAIGAQSIFATDSASAAVSGVPLQLSSARAKTWTLENVHSNRDVYLPVTGIQAGDVAVLIGGGNVTYTLTVKVPAAGGAAIIDPENTPSGSPVVISATGQQYRFIVTNPASFNPWRFVSVDTHTHPASAISDSTTAGRALITAADAAAQRTSLGLGTAATSATGDFAAASHTHELTALAATGAANGTILTANGSGGVSFAAASGGGVTTGSVDNAVLRANGTGGSTSQSSALLIEDEVLAFTSITGDAGTDIITATGSAFANGQRVRFTALTGGSGLNTTTNYFVIGASGATFQLSTTEGGSASLFTTNITAGTLLTGHSVDRHVAITNNSSETNSALWIKTKGRGAFIVDGSGSLATARGAGAIDIQPDRGTNSARVASGELAIAIGDNATASNTRSIAIGGNGVAASGVGSVAIGASNSATARNSIAMGQTALADRCGRAFCHHSNSALGHRQEFQFLLTRTTTNDTAVEMWADEGQSARVTIPSGKVMGGIVCVTGSKSDGSAVALYTRQFVIKNVGGTTTMPSQSTIGTDYEDNASTDITVEANDTNDAIRVLVKGVSGETWRWTGWLHCTEHFYGT